MHGRADRIRRDEQNAELVPRRGCKGAAVPKSIPEIASQRSSECFRIVDNRQAARAPPRSHGAWELAERAPPAIQVSAARHVARDRTEQSAARTEEEVRREQPPIVDILPA